MARSWQRRFLVLALAATIVGAVGVAPAYATWSAGTQSTAGVKPTVVGDGRCSKVSPGSAFELKISKLYQAGTYTGPGGAIITITPTSDQKKFTWTISAGFVVNSVTATGSLVPFDHFDYKKKGLTVLTDSALHAPLLANSLRKLGSGYICYSAVAAPVLGSIGGTKYHDLDADGAFDPGEPTLPGWTIWLYSATAVTSTVTDGSGQYLFPGLAPGTYTVCEGTQENYSQSGPSNESCSDLSDPGEVSLVYSENSLADGGHSVVLTAGQASLGNHFFNFSGEPIACGETKEVPEEGSDASATFTRLIDGCNPEDEKRVQTGIDSDEDGEIVVFIPVGSGISRYVGELTFFKSAGDDNLLVLRYDPDGSGFRDVPACTNVESDEGGVYNAEIPGAGAESWCFTSVQAQPSFSEGEWEVTWRVFGQDDPKFR